MTNVVAVSAQLQVNTSTGTNLGAPDAALLADGRAVFAWSNGTAFTSEIDARFGNPDGTFSAAPLLVGNNIGFAPHVAADDAGPGFAVETTDNQSIFLSYLDASGQLREPTVTTAFGGTQTGTYIGTDVAAHDGGVVFAGDAIPDAVFGQRGPAAGLIALTSPSQIAVGQYSALGGPSLTDSAVASSNPQGVIWASGNGGTSEYAFSGSLLGHYAAGGANGDVAVLPGGEAVAAWNSGADIDYQVLGGASSTLAAANQTPVDGSWAGGQHPAVAGLADGRFVIAWLDDQAGGGDRIEARVFNADGTPATDEFAIGADPAGHQSGISLAADAHGGFVATWIDDTGPIDGSAPNTKVEAQFFDVIEATQTGTAGADTLTGTNGADSLSGGAGDDLLISKGGADVMVGGAGADSFVLSLGGVVRVEDFNPAEGDKVGVTDAAGGAVDGSHGLLSWNLSTHDLTWDADGDAGPQTPVLLGQLDGSATSLNATNLASGFQPSSIRVVALDDSHTDTAFDWSGGQPWDHTVASFDPHGTLAEYDTYYGSGAYTNTWFDNLDNQSWQVRSAEYDAHGQMTLYAYAGHDGTETIWTFDTTNSQPWAHTQQVYSPGGQLEYSAQAEDDGSSWERTYDWNNTQPWSVTLDEYSAAGQHIRHTVFNDDGTVVVSRGQTAFCKLGLVSARGGTI